MTPEDEQLTVLWDPVSGVTEYEIGWNPPSTDGGRAAEVQNPVYVIASLQNDVGYTITVSAGPDNACSLDGTPVGREAMPDPDDSDADDADPDDADPDDAEPDDADPDDADPDDADDAAQLRIGLQNRADAVSHSPHSHNSCWLFKTGTRRNDRPQRPTTVEICSLLHDR